jgi:hypothetical protein
MEQLTQFVSMSFAMRARRAAADCCSRSDTWHPEDVLADRKPTDLHVGRPSVLRQLASCNNNERKDDKLDVDGNEDDGNSGDEGTSSAFRGASLLALPATAGIESHSPTDDQRRHHRRDRVDVSAKVAAEQETGDRRSLSVQRDGSSAAVAPNIDENSNDEWSAKDDDKCADKRKEALTPPTRFKETSSSETDELLERRSPDVDVETVVDLPTAAAAATTTAIRRGGDLQTVDSRTGWFIANVLGRRYDSSTSGNGNFSRHYGVKFKMHLYVNGRSIIKTRASSETARVRPDFCRLCVCPLNL